MNEQTFHPVFSDNSVTSINGINGTSSLASSYSSGTRILIGTSDTTAAPPCDLNVSPNIDDISQSATSDLRKSNKLDAAIDENLPNNLIATPILTDVTSDKLSNSSIWDIYTRRRMNLTVYPVNSVIPQLVNLGISTLDTLDKGASFWTPTTRVGRPTDSSH